MKKFLSLLLLALPMSAGTYTITTTANQDNTLARSVARANRATCQYYGLGNTCTQAQARKEFCRRAGFGGVTTCVPDVDPKKPPVCTTTPLVAACDGAPQVVIYADAAAYLQDETIKMVKESQQAKVAADDAAAFAAALAAANQAQKDAACAALGLAPSCQ